MATRGRPSLYTPEIAEEVLDRLSAGESLYRICTDDHIPAIGTVHGWVTDDREGFAERYAVARQTQAAKMFEELLEITDETPTKMTKTGIAIDGAGVARNRLRADTRKWYLSKVVPKLYGDKVAHEVSGPGGGPIETKDVSALTDEELRAQAAKIQAKLSSTGDE